MERRVRSRIEVSPLLCSEVRLPSEVFREVFSGNPQPDLGELSFSPRPEGGTVTGQGAGELGNLIDLEETK